MRRHLSLWREILRLSWLHEPRLTLAMAGLQIASVIAGMGVAVSLRAAVDATVRGTAWPAVAAAVGAAAAYSLTSVLTGASENIRYLAIDRVCQLALEPKILMELVELEGVEHLDRPDHLDRTTILRHAAWGLLFNFWSGVAVVAAAVQLGLALLLLGQVSPWLLPLLGLALAVLWCDRRASAMLSAADIASAEAVRLHRDLLTLATSPDSAGEIRVALAADELNARQRRAWDEAADQGFRARLAAVRWRLLGWTVFVCGYTAGLATVVHYAASGAATPGDLVLSITLAATLQQSVQTTVAKASDTINTSRLIGHYAWLRDHLVADRARRQDTVAPPPVLQAGITLDRVSFHYPGADRAALSDVSVTIPAASVVAVVGEFGSGKTSLVKLLGKFYRPSHGAILVDGVDLVDIDTVAWRARTTAAYQDFGRYPQATLAESVGMGDLARLDQRDRITAAVHAAAASSLLDQLPDGLDTALGPAFGGVGLSEGQWQKTALSRSAMRQDPLLFIMDEPTASLDAPSESAIFHSFMHRARALAERYGTITVIVSHRFSTVSGADLILVFDRGQIIEAGTHADLIAAGGRYRHLYRLHATAYDLSDAGSGTERVAGGRDQAIRR